MPAASHEREHVVVNRPNDQPRASVTDRLCQDLVAELALP
jgi:hypothetical protein